jgi:Leucine-rich repeat (LRR) protein
MANLKELDLRNCSLTYLENNTFSNLVNLEKLFLSKNKFESIFSITFVNLKHLSHLDLSYNIIEDFMPFDYDPFSSFFNGLFLEEEIFEGLPSLVFLDLSHTKLKQESVRALSLLQSKVEQLSLCYTEISFIAPRMFSETNLKVIDLSGNPSLVPNLVSSWFEGLEEKLEILIFRNSSIKKLEPLKSLKKLKMLDLGKNPHLNL